MSVENRGLVLVAEDEKPIADLIGMYLRRDGFGVHAVATGPDALAAARRLHPVAVILDVGLPGHRRHRGLPGAARRGRLGARSCSAPPATTRSTACSAWRWAATTTSPSRSARARWWPGSRPCCAAPADRSRPTTGRWCSARSSSTAARHRVTVSGEPIDLTATEFDLLAYLMARPGRVVTRDQLLSAVWGYAAAAGTRTVDVHVAQVRAKLGDASPIRTVRGVGYSADEG